MAVRCARINEETAEKAITCTHYSETGLLTVKARAIKNYGVHMW